jgi:hypothetical protein
MTTVTAPVPATIGVRDPAQSEAAGRRTVLGFVATRRVVEVVLVLILGIGSGLLFFGSQFGLNMVHTQLDAQSISFPPKGSPGLSAKEFPDLQQYAGQKVDSGPKAKAYANGFINRHLESASGGRTYSQLSEASRADPTNTKLADQVASSFKGETLRGLLLYAWGWSVVSTIAFYAAVAALIGFVVMLLVTIGDFIADPKIAAHHISQA